MNLPDLERLAELAERATQPGPWTMKSESQGKGRRSYRVIDANGFWVADVDDAPHDAAFIAAASPDVVLALIARVRELEDMLQVSHEQNAALGNANELAVALEEACNIADAALMPNERVSREWYEKFAGNAGAVLRIAALRSLLAGGDK